MGSGVVGLQVKGMLSGRHLPSLQSLRIGGAQVSQHQELVVNVVWGLRLCSFFRGGSTDFVDHFGWYCLKNAKFSSL